MIARRFAATAGLTLGASAIMFGVAAPPERCPSIDVDQARTAAMLAADWFVDNQNADGSWLYEYDRADDRIIPGYNEVRHAGAVSALYLAAARGHDGAMTSADRGLAWAIDHLVDGDGWLGVTDSQTISTGTNALLITGLAERRLLTDDPVHDDLMRGLAQLLVDQTEPSGAVLAYYDLGPDRPRPDVYSIYYTGETYWALARMHRLFPDEGWGAVADRIGHYMATVRDDVEDIWPPLADHWSGYGLAETAAFGERPAGTPLTDDELAFVRRLGGLIGQRVRSISQRFGPWGVVVRGTYTPRGGGYGVFGEGLTGLWRAARLDDRLAPERNDLADRATCIAGLAIDAQVDADEADAYPDPDRVRGAWFIHDVTRMDDQQHAMSALLMTIPILEAVPEPASSGHSAPMWLLWFAVIVATINPARAALAMRDRDRSRRTAALAGATAGALVLLGVGATSGWLLDALDVSRPAARLGAASLCMLSAAVDFWQPRPDPIGDGGRPAAIANGALAIVRPTVLLAGLSVVADHGVGLHLAALATGLGLSAAISETPIGGPSGRVVNWGLRLGASIAFAGGALLVAHAVFDL